MALISISDPTLYDYLDQLASLHRILKECFCETLGGLYIVEAYRNHCVGHIRQSSACRTHLSRLFWYREKVEGVGCKGLSEEV
jgi:hypothetical protein